MALWATLLPELCIFFPPSNVAVIYCYEKEKEKNEEKKEKKENKSKQSVDLRWGCVEMCHVRGMLEVFLRLARVERKTSDGLRVRLSIVAGEKKLWLWL